MTLTRRTLISTGLAGAAASLGGGLTYGQGRGQGRGPGGDDLIAAELRRQMKAAMKKARGRDVEGVRGYAAALRVVAALAESQGLDGQVRTGLQKLGRAAATTGTPDHAAMQRYVDAVGGNEFGLSVHGRALNLPAREQAYDALVSGSDTLSGILRRTAAFMEDAAATKWPGTGLVPIAAQIGGTDQNECLRPCAIADQLWEWAETICMAALIFPAMMPACEFAASAWSGAWMVCITCRMFGGN